MAERGVAMQNPPGNLHRHSRIGALVLTAALLATGVAVGLASGPGASEKTKPPRAATPVYASDEARATAEVNAGRSLATQQAADRAALRAAINSGSKRLDSLPTAEIAVTDIGTSSLAEAVANSERGIVLGRVVSQEAFDGFVLSTIAVAETLRGGDLSEVTVAQAGGPVFSEGIAVAVQASSDPLLHLDRDYILFIRSCQGFDSAPTRDIGCVAGGGRQFGIADGKVVSSLEPEGWMAAVEGLPVAEFKRQILSLP